jgi:carboxymethylenebutenolidase
MHEFATGDHAAQGYRAVPASGSGPGVLVLHAWWGLVPVFTTLCDRLATEGFVACAPDLYDGRTAATVAEAEAVMRASDAERMRTTALAALDRLRHDPAVARGPAVGAVGFSMGANWAFELNDLVPEAFAAVVAFYGTGEADFGRSRAAYLGHFAQTDEYEPSEGVQALEQAMRSAGREVTFHVYPGTGHWFFEEDRLDAYNPAARLAWERTVTFLHVHLG